jgi:16S rRNA (cytosine1402-N4)-methyltransferase
VTEAATHLTSLHTSVMPSEVLAYLDAARGGTFIDCTLGLGGHSELILAASPDNRVIAFDRDAEVIALAEQRLVRFGERFRAIHDDYRSLKTHLALKQHLSGQQFAGILADLGVSSWQLDTPERGFSFRTGSFAPPSQSHSTFPLDMRMDRSGGQMAAHFVNSLGERELADLIFEYGEERASRRIARRIVQERAKAPIETTAQLADLVIRAINQKGHWRIHPATRTFQALRIAVNRELDGFPQFVADAVDLLADEGRLVVLTFHSLEDRLIKQAFRFQAGQCVCPASQPFCSCGTQPRVELLTRKALAPSDAETSANPRSRSAKLRACRKRPTSPEE